ncbi:MAG: glycosyltransferase family 4 protein [Bacteroidia bacterium]|nr:glycosyltransferase family 4 protein [Bacteroidia bacterium]
MNILQLCNKVPYPPKDGGCIAMNNLTQGLLDLGHTVKVLSVNTKKHFIDIEKLPQEYRSKTNIEAVFIDTEIKITQAFLNLFTDKSYNIQRFYSANFENKLIEILQSKTFDIVQLEGLYVSMYVDAIRKYSKAKIVFRAHNVEYKLWEHATQLATNPLKKAYLKLLTKRLKQYELNSLPTFDAIATITKKDENHFKRAGFLKAMETLPFGIDLKNTIENNSVQEEYPSVFHIGAMDWQPNIEGLDWFLNNVWDKLNAKHPQLKLYLAGRNMSADLKRSNKPNVIIVGEVENAQEFIESKGLMIVPLLSGSGMRVKIIEGLALGKTIVTTSIGAEGIDCENNKNCIIADDATTFAEAISKCISEKTFYNEIGKNAKILALQQYNNADICKRLVQFYQKILTDNV